MKIRSKRAAALTLALVLGLGPAAEARAEWNGPDPGNNTAWVGPVGDRIDSGYYDEETLARLQDNVLEYDEIPDLVHEYNSTVTDVWEDLEDARQDLYKNVEKLESSKLEMKHKKERAEDDGEMDRYVNFYMQEAILDAVASGVRSAASSLLSDTTKGSLQKMENQFTKAAQSLMISYDSLTKQKNTVEKLAELYGEQYRLAADKRAQGMATDTEVLTAQTNQLSAQSTLESINAALLQMKPTLCRLTGWAADANPEIAPVPSVDQSRLDAMNLETDTRKAIGNNTTLIGQRTSAKGKTYAGVEARLNMINEGDAKLTIKMKELYNDVYSKKAAYEAACDGYESAKKARDGYQRMYQLGMLSKSDYLGTEVSFYQAEASWKAADTAFLLAVETYGWAVKGLTEIE